MTITTAVVMKEGVAPLALPHYHQYLLDRAYSNRNLTLQQRVALHAHAEQDNIIAMAELARGCPYVADIIDPVQCEALLVYFQGQLTRDERFGLLDHLDNPRYMASSKNMPPPPGFSHGEAQAELALRNALRVPCRCCGTLVSPYRPVYQKSGLCEYDCGWC